MSNRWALCVLLMGGASSQALAQSGSAVRDNQNASVEEIVVTAQRRSERLQNVPVAVNAITSAGLEARGLDSAVALSAAVPGLTFATQGLAGAPFLRGVGSGSGNPTDEPSVATYIDGVYIGAPFTNVFGFNNIERVEVLKGPQGTLFGRNATGGVIHVITRDPSPDTSAEASLGYANYQTVSGSAYLNAGLAEGVAVNFAGQFQDQGKGYGRSLTLGTETYKQDELSLRAKLLLEPTERTRVILSGDYGKINSAGLNYQLPRGVAGIDGNADYPGRYNTRNDYPNAIRVRQRGVSLRIEQDLDFAKLISISAYRKAKGFYGVDADATPVSGTAAAEYQDQKSVSQELHLVSPDASPITWLVGAFYYRSSAAYDPLVLLGAAAGGLDYLNIYGRQKTRSGSIFAQATGEILADTKLTAGLRYTTEKQHLISSIDSNIGIIAPRDVDSQSIKRATWRLALDHRFTPDIMAYASYNRGIKSGGFDPLSFGSFKPETLDAYEVGVKSELFGRRLRLNASAFWYDYKNIQVQVVTQGFSTTLNAAGARIRGMDVDFEAVPVNNLTLSGGFAYTDGEYTNYSDAISFAASPGPAVIFDARGRDTVRTPKWTGSFNADYRIPSSIGDFTIAGSLTYSGSFAWAADNRLKQDVYALLNGSIRWQHPDEHFNIRLWVRNLTDKHYLAQGVSSGNGDIIVQATPRTYGITVGAKL